MSIELTTFKSIFDNKTNKKYSFNTWDDFTSALFELSKLQGYKLKKGERSTKKSSPLISPAIYEKGTTRANANVLHWSKWAALDIDEYEGDFRDVIKKFCDYNFVCYSSASSTKEHPKFRIVLELDDIVPNEKIKHFWFALNTEFSSLNDPQTKDLSRMYYVPAQYPDAYNFIFKNSGKTLSPFSLMSKHTFVEQNKDFLSKLPVEMQRAVVQHRKDSLQNLDITWTSYLDCPFINKSMMDEYSSMAYTDGSGRYSFFYKLMVNIAGNAVRKGYPITPSEISSLMREIDQSHGGLYHARPLEMEADRALIFVIRNTMA